MIRSHDTSPTAVDEANKTRKPREYPRTPFPFDATKSSLSAIVETRESPDEQSDAWEPGSAPHDALAPEILDAANTPLPASAQPRTKYNSIENFRELAGCDDREGLSNSSEARCFKTDSISSFSDTEDLLAELLKYEENPQDFSVEEVQFVEKERHRGCNREDKENSIDEKSIPPETSRKRSSSESRVLGKLIASFICHTVLISGSTTEEKGPARTAAIDPIEPDFPRYESDIADSGAP